MKNKPLRISTRRTPAPQSAQLTAVRKLSRTGRHEDAQARVAELSTRYPDFKPLLALAWEVDDSAGDFLSACLHAWDWSVACPNSLAALEALRDSAFAAGLPALATKAAQGLANAEGSRFPDLPPLPGTLAELTFDQAVAVDLSRLFLTFGRYDETVTTLEGIDHPSTRNNLALARFAQGDVAAALAAFEENWHQEPLNLFALNQLVRLRLWKGGCEFACELNNALRAAQPQRPEVAYGKLIGLLLLGAYDDALDAWLILRNAGFWNAGNVFEQSSCAYLAGLAALHKGDREAADKLFSEAIDLDPDNFDADMASIAVKLDVFDQETDLKIGEFGDWLPQSWIAKFKSVKGEHATEAVLEAQQRSCSAHADYLAAAAALGGEAVRFYALSILKFRAIAGDAAAREKLLWLLCHPCGPDKVRLDLDIWLKEKGLVEAGQPQQLLVRGKVQELALRPVRLHAEQRDLGLPPESQAKLEQMHHLLAKHDLNRALRMAEGLVALYPEQPVLVGNVANIKQALNHDVDDIETLYQRAVTLDPEYLFAKVGLARIALRKGNVESAQELLKLVASRGSYHVSEWRAILMAEREIAIAKNDWASELNLNEALDVLDEQFG
jgi:tetratricopeptide (TPR) repeat protein